MTADQQQLGDTVTTKTAPAAFPVHRDRQGRPLLIVVGVLFLLCAVAGFLGGVLA